MFSLPLARCPVHTPAAAENHTQPSELSSMTSMPASGVYQCLAEVKVMNRKGLHARASASFVKCVEKFDAEVSVTKDGQTVNGSSIMGLMMLAAGPGSIILIETEGPEAEEALDALTSLVESRFHEQD
jgi:phosphocarrier protein HPr